MSQLNVQNLSNENEDGAPEIANISDFSATSYMCPPKGTTAQRPSSPNPGDIRFNTDTASLEYYKGDTLNWTQIEMTSPDLDGGARACMGGGYSPVHPTIVNTINYLTIPTLGSAADFGDMTNAYFQNGACASRTRGIIAGGRTPSFIQDIEYITISSTGNGTDFGGNLLNMYTPASCSDQTRGIFANGYVPSSPNYSNAIDYITIASTGQNANDFGDLTVARGFGWMCSSSTRGVSMGGYTGSATVNTIDYVTISTTGNAADFGDLSAVSYDNSCASNSTRGFSLGGTPTGTNTIEYITIASTGNAINFGDLTQLTLQQCAAADPTRLLRMGGTVGPTFAGFNTVDYITIATTGDAIDWGDLPAGHRLPWGLSNAHGGL